MDATQLASQVGAAILLAGLAFAGFSDWRRREVSDNLWIALAVAGTALGAAVLFGAGILPGLLWLLLGVFVLEHMVPWDEHLGRLEEAAGYVELGFYLGVGAALAVSGWRYGIGPTAVPVVAVAAYLSVLFARGLFEARVLYGGADAKALMVAGLLVPVYSEPLVRLSANAVAALGFFPFPFTLLLNAAILAVVVPLALLVQNARRGEAKGLRSFTGYWINVRDLPDRFVWVRDPTFQRDPEEAEVETSEDDRKLRERQRDRLVAAGVGRVWVTPQIPFVTLMAAGAVVGVLAGSLAFDLFALL